MSARIRGMRWIRSHMSGLARRFRGLAPRDRRALLLGLAVLVPAVGWVGVVRPWWNQVSELRDAAAAERALLERETALLRDGPDLPDRLATAELALRRKESRLVDYPNIALAEAAVASHIEESAGDSRALLLEVRSLQPAAAEAPPDGLVPIRLGIRAESDFEGLLSLMNALEAHPLLLRLVGISMQPEEDPGVMTLEAIVEAYAPTGTRREDTAESAARPLSPAPVLQRADPAGADAQ